MLFAQNNKISTITAEPDNKIKKLYLFGNNFWRHEATDEVLTTDPINLINYLFLKNEVFRYLCTFSKTLMPSCRSLVVSRSFNFNGQNKNLLFNNCVDELFSVIN